MRSRLACVVVLVTVGLPALAYADMGEAPALYISGMDSADATPVIWAPNGVSSGSDVYAFNGDRVADHWTCHFEITAKADPWINAVISVTNTTAVTQTYTFITTLPVSPTLAAPTQHGGSMQGGLTDNTWNGVLASVTTDPVSQAPLYMGMIDGVGVLPIYPHSTSFTAPADFGSTSIPAVNVLPPTLPSGAVTSTIGIKHTFTLTAGDSATFSSVFVVVPEPATLALVALGGAVLARRRRA